MYFTSIAKQALSLYKSRSMSVSWILNQYSRRLYGKISKAEPAHHGIRTWDIWNKRLTLYLCSTVFLWSLAWIYRQVCLQKCNNNIGLGFPCSIAPLYMQAEDKDWRNCAREKVHRSLHNTHAPQSYFRLSRLHSIVKQINILHKELIKDKKIFDLDILGSDIYLYTSSFHGVEGERWAVSM